EKFKLIRANDDATVLDALSFSTPKIRLLRSLTVEKKNSVQPRSLSMKHHHEIHKETKIYACH
ncbi:hypothetical protein ZWY2020_039095, partial [Hordeum vulgare]